MKSNILIFFLTVVYRFKTFFVSICFNLYFPIMFSIYFPEIFFSKVIGSWFYRSLFRWIKLCLGIVVEKERFRVAKLERNVECDRYIRVILASIYFSGVCGVRKSDVFRYTVGNKVVSRCEMTCLRLIRIFLTFFRNLLEMLLLHYIYQREKINDDK